MQNNQPNVELLDSSEFYGTSRNQLKYAKHIFNKYINKPRTLKFISFALIWWLGALVNYNIKINYSLKKISIQYKLHTMYVIFSGQRKEGSMSAYSIFNKGYYSLLGTFKPEDVDSMFGKDTTKKRIEQDLSESSPFDGLTDDQMMAKLSRLGNKPCFCNSGRKYKKEKYDKIEEDKRAQQQRRMQQQYQ